MTPKYFSINLFIQILISSQTKADEKHLHYNIFQKCFAKG